MLRVHRMWSSCKTDVSTDRVRLRECVRMNNKRSLAVAVGLLLTLSNGCRSVLPSEQPSRIWDAYTEQRMGLTGFQAVYSPSIPCPTRMVHPVNSTVDPTVRCRGR